MLFCAVLAAGLSLAWREPLSEVLSLNPFSSSSPLALPQYAAELRFVVVEASISIHSCCLCFYATLAVRFSLSHIANTTTWFSEDKSCHLSLLHWYANPNFNYRFMLLIISRCVALSLLVSDSRGMPVKFL